MAGYSMGRWLQSWALCFSLLAFGELFSARVSTGADVFFESGQVDALKGKRVGLITNHTGIDAKLRLTAERLFEAKDSCKLTALFCPEHGLEGSFYADEKIKDSAWEKLPVYSLHGKTRRPTDEMLKNIDVLIYDIQCIGSRSYTYAATLFYAMEEAAKRDIEVVVLDRPNPMGGLIVDGPMLEEKWRSFIGYVNVPYCHGMTIGELARFFNAEYKIGCNLKVIPMRGWKRSMSFADTGLPWIPPSPNMPESDTPLFYPATGIMGQLRVLNIGIGYTMPFKIAGAPWIDASKYAELLNAQKLGGVQFVPFHFKPFYGLYKGEECHGVLIKITDLKLYKPVKVQYLLLGILKSLYPKRLAECLEASGSKDPFHKANGTEEVFRVLSEEKYTSWKLLEIHAKEREAFLSKRSKYLLPEYAP